DHLLGGGTADRRRRRGERHGPVALRAALGRGRHLVAAIGADDEGHGPEVTPVWEPWEGSQTLPRATPTDAARRGAPADARGPAWRGAASSRSWPADW